jgi:hypothetical protein
MIKEEFNEEEEENDDFFLEDDLLESDEIILIDDEGDDKEEIMDSSNDEEIILSNHKIEGKHSLKYDSIFKGKKEEPLYEEDYEMEYTNNSIIEVDKSSLYHQESIDNESYIRSKLVKERIYEKLKTKTNISFTNNRRKPSRIDFNNYYTLLVKELKNDSFTHVEIFNELSVYFSDNLFNMFKLLDNKWRNIIIDELQDHIGKNKKSKEISNRNIYQGTEVEFNYIDEFDNSKMITGVVIETRYYENTFIIDSYEKLYEINLEDITKIINNTKFRYNLNKLNNIDFL